MYAINRNRNFKELINSTTSMSMKFWKTLSSSFYTQDALDETCIALDLKVKCTWVVSSSDRRHLKILEIGICAIIVNRVNKYVTITTYQRMNIIITLLIYLSHSQSIYLHIWEIIYLWLKFSTRKYNSEKYSV